MLDAFETPQEFCVVTEFAQVLIFSINMSLFSHACPVPGIAIPNLFYHLLLLLFQGELFEVLEDDKCLPEEQVQAIAKQLVHLISFL